MKLSLALVSLVFALAGSSVAAPAPHNLGLEVRSIRASKATGLTPLQARHSGNGNGNGQLDRMVNGQLLKGNRERVIEVSLLPVACTELAELHTLGPCT